MESVWDLQGYEQEELNVLELHVPRSKRDDTKTFGYNFGTVSFGDGSNSDRYQAFGNGTRA